MRLDIWSVSYCQTQCCPIPHKWLITVLFVGTALSISSVKIVAMVVREVGFLCRTSGQVIVASQSSTTRSAGSIMSVTFGLALHSGVDLRSVAQGVVGTALFLIVRFTLGRRLSCG